MRLPFDPASIIEAAPDGIVVSRDARIVYANPAAARLLGYSDSSALIGVHMESFLAAGELAVMRERIERMIRARAPLPPHEYDTTRRDGEKIVVEITSLLMEYEGEGAVVAIARDVTDRARMRARLAHADRLASLGTLAAGVAHEINNPLAYVSLGLSSVERHLQSQPGEDHAHALETLRSAVDGVERIATIVRELTAFARPDPDDSAETADAREAIHAAQRLVGHQISQRARVTIDVGELPAVVGSSSRLQQVFMNLLLNAAHAIEGEALGDIVVSSRREGDLVMIEIRDDGRGIDARDLARVFDPFFTTKPTGEGTGLGLFVCAGIVRKYGGDIALRSELGNGTTAIVKLVVAQRSVAAGPSEKAAIDLPE